MVGFSGQHAASAESGKTAKSKGLFTIVHLANLLPNIHSDLQFEIFVSYIVSRSFDCHFMTKFWKILKYFLDFKTNLSSEFLLPLPLACQRTL